MIRPLAVLSLLLSTVAAQTTPKPTPPQPQTHQAPGAAPDKVWVNNTTHVYHCPGARYYGKTKDGKYLTEAEAKKEGDKPARGEACFK
jgi:hypothetical protein